MDYRLQQSLTILAGRSGSGKTTFSLKHMVNVDASARFIFDYKGEFSDRLRLPAAGTVRELEAALASRWILFNPHRMFPGKLTAAQNFFCDWCFQVSQRGRGRKILYLDEAWKFCDPYNLPEELANCVQTGRIHGLQTMFMTQVPNKLNGAILNEVTEYVCFSLQKDRAIKTATEAGVPEDVPGRLAKGEFYAVNCDTDGVLTGRVF